MSVGFDGRAQGIIGQSPAQFNFAVWRHGCRKFSRAASGGCCRFWQGRIQGKYVRKGGLQFANRAVEGGLRGGVRCKQCDIRIRKGDGAGAKCGKCFQACHNRVSPFWCGHAKADGAACSRGGAKIACGGENPVAGALGVGGTGVKSAALIIHHKAKGEGCQHRARGGNGKIDSQSVGGQFVQIGFKFGFFRL